MRKGVLAIRSSVRHGLATASNSIDADTENLRAKADLPKIPRPCEGGVVTGPAAPLRDLQVVISLPGDRHGSARLRSEADCRARSQNRLIRSNFSSLVAAPRVGAKVVIEGGGLASYTPVGYTGGYPCGVYGNRRSKIRSAWALPATSTNSAPQTPRFTTMRVAQTRHGEYAVHGLLPEGTSSISQYRYTVHS